MIREVLRMEKVTYKEQGRILLDNFNITVRKGEVFGLIPVNRYGMDAFLKLLQQNMPLHYGYVYYREQLVNQWQRSHNRTNRISIIRNKSSLAEDLTVVDNIFVLRRGFHKYLIHPGMLERLLQPFLDEIGINIPAGAYVSELTIFQKFVTEVLKAVVAGSQLIVLENVSTFISESELEELHRIIRLYAERGISFIYITAHFEEATYLCDRMALMVNGQIIKTFQRGDPIPDTFPLQSVEEYDRWVRSQHRRQEADTDRQTVLIMDKIQYGNLKDITIRVGQGECVVLQDLDNRCIADFVELFQGEIPEKGSFYLTKGTQKSEKNTTENTLKNVKITNIKFTKQPELGTGNLYYKNVNDFAKSEINENNKIENELQFETTSTNEVDLSKPVLYNNCANPITLSYVNQNIKTDYTMTDTQNPITYNGKLLKRCGVSVKAINTSISFDIEIENNKNQKFRTTIYFDIPYESEEKTINDGSIIVEKKTNFNFYRYE